MPTWLVLAWSGTYYTGVVNSVLRAYTSYSCWVLSPGQHFLLILTTIWDKHDGFILQKWKLRLRKHLVQSGELWEIGLGPGAFTKCYHRWGREFSDGCLYWYYIVGWVRLCCTDNEPQSLWLGTSFPTLFSVDPENWLSEFHAQTSVVHHAAISYFDKLILLCEQFKHFLRMKKMKPTPIVFIDMLKINDCMQKHFTLLKEKKYHIKFKRLW